MRLIYEEDETEIAAWEAESDFLEPPIDDQCDALAAKGLLQFPLIGSTAELPMIRHRVHTICALYAHTPRLSERLRLLDALETLTLQIGQMLAVELLEGGWRPPEGGPPLAA